MPIGKRKMVKQDRNPGGRPERPIKTPAKDPTDPARVHSQRESLRRSQPDGNYKKTK